MYRIARSLFIFLFIGSMTSCNIYDSLPACEKDIFLEFKYFGDNKDKANEIAKFITEEVLYVYDNSTGKLVKKFKLSKEEIRTGKHIMLKDGSYKFICWGNQWGRSQVVNDTDLSLARIASPAYFKKEKIHSNDPLYYASKKLDVNSSLDQQNNSGDHRSQKETLIFRNAHKSFKIRVYGIKSKKNLELELTNLMPEYDFDMRAAAPFKTSYFPTVTSSGTDNGVYYREFDFSVLQFTKENSKNINIKLTNGDDGKLIIPSVSLYELLIKNNIDLTNRQEVTIEIDFKFTGAGVSVEIKKWKDNPTIPGV